jgi:hypothetical protein
VVGLLALGLVDEQYNAGRYCHAAVAMFSWIARSIVRLDVCAVRIKWPQTIGLRPTGQI